MEGVKVMLAFSRSYENYDWKPDTIQSLEEFESLIDTRKQEYKSITDCPGFMLCLSDEELPNISVGIANEGWVVIANVEIDGDITQLRLDEGKESEIKYMVYWDEIQEIDSSWFVSVDTARIVIDFWLKNNDLDNSAKWIETSTI